MQDDDEEDDEDIDLREDERTLAEQVSTLLSVFSSTLKTGKIS
jgi:hypothetical protein